MSNKIKYGLSNVYYAVATIASNGSATYSAPVAIPGAVNLSLDPEGASDPFYADNIVYFMSSANSGYTGTLEVALLPDSFRKDVLGEIEDGQGVFLEDADAITKHFALLFQFEGDANKTRHVLYNCTATRSAVSSETKQESITPVTDSIDIVAGMVYNSTFSTNLVKARNDDTTSTSYSTWFTTVYQGTANA